MAIYDATKNQVTHRLTFSKRDANARDAVTDHELRMRFKALFNQGDPIPKALGEYILACLDKRPIPARRPINVPAYFHKLAMGSEVDRRVSNGMKYEAAVSEVCDLMPEAFGTKRGSKKSIASVKAAYTLFRRAANIAPRPRSRRKR